MKLVLSVDEVLDACVAYLNEQGFKVSKADMTFHKHVEGEYEEAIEVVDGVSVKVTNGGFMQGK